MSDSDSDCVNEVSNKMKIDKQSPNFRKLQLIKNSAASSADDSSDEENDKKLRKKNILSKKNLQEQVKKAEEKLKKLTALQNANSDDSSDISSDDEPETPILNRHVQQSNKSKINNDDGSAKKKQIDSSVTPNTSKSKLNSSKLNSKLIQAANLNTRKDFLQKMITNSNDMIDNIIKQKEIVAPKSILKKGKPKSINEDSEKTNIERKILPLSQELKRRQSVGRDTSYMDTSFANVLSSTQILTSQNSSSSSDENSNTNVSSVKKQIEIKKNIDGIKTPKKLTKSQLKNSSDLGNNSKSNSDSVAKKSPLKKKEIKQEAQNKIIKTKSSIKEKEAKMKISPIKSKESFKKIDVLKLLNNQNNKKSNESKDSEPELYSSLKHDSDSSDEISCGQRTLSQKEAMKSLPASSLINKLNTPDSSSDSDSDANTNIKLIDNRKETLSIDVLKSLIKQKNIPTPSSSDSSDSDDETATSPKKKVIPTKNFHRSLVSKLSENTNIQENPDSDSDLDSEQETVTIMSKLNTSNSPQKSNTILKKEPVSDSDSDEETAAAITSKLINSKSSQKSNINLQENSDSDSYSEQETATIMSKQNTLTSPQKSSINLIEQPDSDSDSEEEASAITSKLNHLPQKNNTNQQEHPDSDSDSDSDAKEEAAAIKLKLNNSKSPRKTNKTIINPQEVAPTIKSKLNNSKSSKKSKLQIDPDVVSDAAKKATDKSKLNNSKSPQKKNKSNSFLSNQFDLNSEEVAPVIKSKSPKKNYKTKNSSPEKQSESFIESKKCELMIDSDEPPSKKSFLDTSGRIKKLAGANVIAVSIDDNMKDFSISNPTLKKIDDAGTKFCFNDLNDDEEVWLMQIPKNLDPNLMKEQKLNFGKGKLKLKVDGMKFEYETQKTDSKICLIANKLKSSNDLHAKSIKTNGTIIVHEVLKQTSSDIKVPKKTKVQPPADLKVRHPIFGLNFQEKIDLNESITSKLLEAEIMKQKADKKIENKKKRKSMKKLNQPEDLINKDEMIFKLLGETKNDIKKSKKRKTDNQDKKIHTDAPTSNIINDDSNIPEFKNFKKFKEQTQNLDKKLHKNKKNKNVDTSIDETDSIAQLINIKSAKSPKENKEKKVKKLKKSNDSSDTITQLLNAELSNVIIDTKVKLKTKNNKLKSTKNLLNGLELTNTNKKNKNKEHSLIESQLNLSKNETKKNKKMNANNKISLGISNKEEQIELNVPHKSKKKYKTIDSQQTIDKDSLINSLINSVKESTKLAKKEKRKHDGVSDGNTEYGAKKKSKKMSNST